MIDTLKITDFVVPRFPKHVKFKYNKPRDEWVILAPERLVKLDEQLDKNLKEERNTFYNLLQGKNKQEVITELNSRWLISITESLCKLKDDGHQFVLLHSLMRMIQVYNSKLFMVGFFNTINQNGDVVEMADIKGSDYATHIPSGGWSELWDGLQARFENDYVFSTIGKNIDGVMTNKICKMIFREFISRINPIVMTEVSKSDILNDK